MLALPASAQAQDAGSASGDIFQVTGDASKAYVIRNNGQRVRAEPYLLLYDGDRVVAGKGVRILLRGIKAKPVPVTAKDGPFLVQETGNSIAMDALRWLQRFDVFFSSKPRALIVHNLPRDEAAPRLFRPDFLSGPRQFVPAGLTSLTIVWRGGAGSATMVDSVRGEIHNPPTSFARSTFTGSFSTSVRVYFGKQNTEDSGWQLESADPSSIPLPPWSQKQPDSDRERALRAIWILTEGPDDWRLFATSELELLKETDHLAGRFWHLMGSGQWPAAS